MNGRLLRPRASGHPEALAWKTAVIANGGTVSESTMTAVTTFCRSIDAAGLRSLLWRVNPMAGNDLSAALVPLYRATSFSGSVQGNTTDTNFNFVSGDYSATSGLIGNGSTKVLNTGLAANFRSGRHVGFIPNSIGTTAFRYYMGVRNGGSPANGGLYAPYISSPTTLAGAYTYTDAGDAGGADNGTVVLKRLYLVNNVSGAGGTTMYANGSATGAAGAGNDTAITAAFAIFAVGQNAGTFAFYTNARLAGYTIGENMTASQVGTYNAIWTTLLTALGRA
jgi:hypothetical protein